MKFTNLLDNVFLRFGNYIEKISSVVALGFLIIAIVFFLLYLFNKNKLKKKVLYNGVVLFSFYSLFCYFYLIKLVYGQILISTM